jgi:hypothetical protein
MIFAEKKRGDERDVHEERRRLIAIRRFDYFLIAAIKDEAPVRLFWNSDDMLPLLVFE